MATKRIKFLSRIKILQEDIQIRLEVNGPTKRFTATLRLDEYGFPPEARVWIEAKQLLETLRFDWATIGRLRQATAVDVSRLRGDRVTFNVFVLEPHTARKLGAVETIRPNIEAGLSDDNIPLLPVDASASLDSLLWRVDYTDSDQEGHTDAPVLMFDRIAAKGSATEFVQNPAVRAMVLPAAMREILTKILIVDQIEYDPASRSWRDSWVRFASQLTGDLPPGLEDLNFKDEATGWILAATSRLAKKADFLEFYIREFNS